MGTWIMAQGVNHNLVYVINNSTGPSNFQFCPAYMYRYVPSLSHEKVKFQFGHFNDLYIFEEYKAVFNYIITGEFCIIADWGAL